jgi:Mrp family chromosome partitioning ATPase
MVASSLAVSLAAAGKRVLLIDATCGARSSTVC